VFFESAAMLKRVPFGFAGDVLRWAAWLYHVEQRTQIEIAEELDVSRQTVANYLNDAMSQGLVQIQIRPDILKEHSLASELKSCFGLTDVHIIPTPSSAGQLIDRLGRAGGQVIHNMTADGDVMGVAFGRTVQRLGAFMPSSDQPNTKVVQVAGCSIGGTGTSPEVCAALIASKMSAQCANLFAPAYCSNRQLTTSLLAEPSLKRQFDLFSKIDLMVFGVGQLNSETELTFNEDHFSDDAIRDEYLKLGAVGVVYGRFINSSGHEIDGPMKNLTIAIDLQTTLLAQKRVAICGGKEKTAAIFATLKAGFVTHFVTDEQTAKRILRAYKQDVLS
jgi:DNA-binding transcriptional regulator LsrR (DeoR family)